MAKFKEEKESEASCPELRTYLRAHAPIATLRKIIVEAMKEVLQAGGTKKKPAPKDKALIFKLKLDSAVSKLLELVRQISPLRDSGAAHRTIAVVENKAIRQVKRKRAEERRQRRIKRISRRRRRSNSFVR